MTKNKRERSTKNRNHLGAMLGGIIGTLAFYKIYPSMIITAFGCYLGVITGYWYQEIGIILKTSWGRAQALSGGKINQSREAIKARAESLIGYSFISAISIIGLIMLPIVLLTRFFNVKKVRPLSG